jgi:hypothetical protein
MSVVLHPGNIPSTALAKNALVGEEMPAFIPRDTLDLPAAVTLHLAAGKADWLNGR